MEHGSEWRSPPALFLSLLSHCQKQDCCAPVAFSSLVCLSHWCMCEHMKLLCNARWLVHLAQCCQYGVAAALPPCKISDFPVGAWDYPRNVCLGWSGSITDPLLLNSFQTAWTACACMPLNNECLELGTLNIVSQWWCCFLKCRMQQHNLSNMFLKHWTFKHWALNILPELNSNKNTESMAKKKIHDPKRACHLIKGAKGMPARR